MSRHSTSPEVHVLPIRVYLLVAAFLLILTAVTVAVAQSNFGSWNLIVALVIAAIKGSLVALFFMHLKYDNRLFAFIFLLAIGFLAIFVIFTMFDTLYRDQIYRQRAEPIATRAMIYDAEGVPIPMESRTFGASEGNVPGGAAAEEVPFELQHGYGPIKEVIEVGPLDTALAMRGRPIFESKCATCHKLDERYTGPPLRGVTAYRSPTFIMNQILDPTRNVAKHPDMQAMLKTYFTIMTNQNVTREDARALVEYLRWEAQRGPQTQEESGDES